MNQTRAATTTDGAGGRFGDLPRAAACALIAGLLALTAYGLGVTLRPTPVPPAAHAVNGIRLYGAIVERMRRGEPYERAAVSELRAEGGPLRPFVTVRPPALAWLLSRLPDPWWGRAALTFTAALTLVVWTWRLRAWLPAPWWLAAAPVMFSGVGMALIGADGLALFHEAWAGVLMALSLALRTERRFLAAAAVGLLAGLVRELALPFLAVMALAAATERRRAETAAFAAALALALAALGWHAAAETALVRPGDFASPGWIAVAGWPFVLLMSRWNLIVIFLGAWAGALLTPAALAGAINPRGGLGLRLGALVAGYAAGFMVVGRMSNGYWGLVTAPIFAVGLCLAPLAARDLARAALNARRSLP